MTASMKSLGIDRLDIDQRLALIDEIWASICSDGDALPTQAQREELARRVADHDAHPDDVVPWSTIKADIAARRAK